MQSRRSGEPQSAYSRTSFDDMERLIFPTDDVEANAGFGLSDLTEESEDEDITEETKKPLNNDIEGHINGNGMVRSPGGGQEYREVTQKENSQPPLR